MVRSVSSSEGRQRRTPSSRQTSHGDSSDLDDFQNYQRFRLKVVSMFGSMASGLFEFGADPETGRISQKDFVRVCVKLEMMNEREAQSLYQHFTNADPWDEEEVVATFKDFSIDEDEWRYVVASKQEAQMSNSTAIPFSSAPSGISTGLYHRPVNVNQVSEQQRDVPQEGTPRSQGTPRSLAFRRTRTTRTAGSSSKRSSPPWRQPQKPWAPSIMAGMGLTSLEAKTVLVFRPRGGSISTKGRSSLDGPWVRQGQEHTRKSEMRTEAWKCPTSREEMQPAVCAKQVLDWWPYSSPAPLPKVKLKRR